MAIYGSLIRSNPAVLRSVISTDGAGVLAIALTCIGVLRRLSGIGVGRVSLA